MQGWVPVPVVFFTVVRFFVNDSMVAVSLEADNVGVYDVEPKSAGGTNPDDLKSDDAAV